jgi:hypothetical protein
MSVRVVMSDTGGVDWSYVRFPVIIDEFLLRAFQSMILLSVFKKFFSIRAHVHLAKLSPLVCDVGFHGWSRDPVSLSSTLQNHPMELIHCILFSGLRLYMVEAYLFRQLR